MVDLGKRAGGAGNDGGVEAEQQAAEGGYSGAFDQGGD